MTLCPFEKDSRFLDKSNVMKYYVLYWYALKLLLTTYGMSAGVFPPFPICSSRSIVAYVAMFTAWVTTPLTEDTFLLNRKLVFLVHAKRKWNWLTNFFATLFNEHFWKCSCLSHLNHGMEHQVIKLLTTKHRFKAISFLDHWESSISFHLLSKTALCKVFFAISYQLIGIAMTGLIFIYMHFLI